VPAPAARAKPTQSMDRGRQSGRVLANNHGGPGGDAPVERSFYEMPDDQAGCSTQERAFPGA
jgi:hypothetical protein